MINVSSEKVYAMVVMIMGAISFGYLISQIAKILEDPNEDFNVADASQFHSYLSEKARIPLDLQSRAKRAFQYTVAETRRANTLLNSFMASSSILLHSQLIIHAYKLELQEIKLLEIMVSLGFNEFVSKILVNSFPLELDEGETVYERGDLTTELFFVLRGRIRLEGVLGGHDKIEGYVNAGEYFADTEFLLSCDSIATYRADSYCQLLSIRHEILDDICEKYLKEGKFFIRQLHTRCEHFLISLHFNAVRSSNDSHDSEKLWVDGRSVDSIIVAPTSSKCDDPFDSYRVFDSNKFSRLSTRAIWNKRVIHPQFIYKRLWDCLIEIFILYSVLVISVQIAFYRQSLGGWFVMDMIVYAFFMVDMLFSFQTAYYDSDKKAYILDSYAIARRYLITWFLIDFISSIPWDLIAESAAPQGASSKIAIEVSILRLVRVLRIMKLNVLYGFLTRYVRTENAVVFDLVELIAKILILCHCVTCLWWSISIQTTGPAWFNDVNMVLIDHLRDSRLLYQYIISAYWSLTTLTTIGYGDIFPLNSGDRVVVILIVLIGASSFGYTLGYVATIFEVTVSPKVMLSIFFDFNVINASC